MKKMTRRRLIQTSVTSLGSVLFSASLTGFNGLLAADGKIIPEPELLDYGIVPGRWTAQRANEWQARYPWIVGCNYVVSSAVNQLEMWQADTFDPETLNREFALAESIGLNTVRIFLHDLAWQQDPEGFKGRMDTVLQIAAKHHLWVLYTFFTNGGPGVPIKIGKQPDPKPGVHNSGWLQSPGADVVNHPEKWGYLQDYVTDVLSSFAQDERVLCWCLYNEPENEYNNNFSLPLLRTVWKWGREVNPSQPFTAPIFLLPSAGNPRSRFPICAFLGENCDIMNFHCYESPETVQKFISMLEDFHRPIICTEYMDRPGNTLFNVTPILKNHNVGAIHFGLVNGKCNFQFHGPNELPEPKQW
ncbi:MAG: hypothetical protein IKW74_06190, partial [Thermoguttaceae bacterium]|nr:hypothetical protein [Thermoguttaceae bacterium]